MKPPMPFLGYSAKHKLLVMAYNGNNIIVYDACDGAEVCQAGKKLLPQVP